MSKKGRKRGRDGSHDGIELGMPSNRKRQVTDDKLQLYKLYEDLAAESDEVRLEAAKQLIVKYSPESRPAAEDVQKALNRLIQGLCTHRKAARFGFCVTLTELLRQLFRTSTATIEGLDLDVESLLKRVERQTKVEGNVSGMERRDHLIGRLFAYKAIMQSSIPLEPDLSLEAWNELLDRIYGMARDIPWLREECGLILVEAIKGLNGTSEFLACAQALVQRLVSFNLVNTPEGVSIWLALQEDHETVLPAKVWHNNDPLSKKERTRLGKILKEDFRSGSENGKSEAVKSAPANPNPPFAWDLIMSKLLQIDSKSKEDRAEVEKSEFSQFWLDTVDAYLFGSSASHERKSWGFKIFVKILGQVPDCAVPSLFSPNFMRTLLNQTKKDDRFLHATALNAWKAISHRAQQSPGSAISLVVALTSKNGTADFHNFSKAKTLEQILQAADDDTLRKIVRHLHSLVIRPNTTDQVVADQRRQTIADLLLSIVRHYKRYDGLSPEFFEKDDWLRNILELMIEYAYFVPSPNAKTRKVPLPLISESSRKTFQERLSSCLTRLLNVESGSQTSFGMMVIQMIRSKALFSKSLTPIFKADETVMGTVDKAFQTLDTIVSKSSTTGTTSAAQGFLLLYTFTLLQVYNGDTDAVMMLDDIDASRKATRKTAKDTSAEGQNGFVEIFLSFLGNPRILFHKIAMEAFTTFTSELNADGLRSMIDVLDIEESLEGQRHLFAQDEETDDDMDDASDVEMIDDEPSNSNESEEDDSEEEEESNDAESELEDDADDESEDEELTQFNNMLAMTLQTSKRSMNGENADEETSDESDMDDEQMMALDPHLSKMFMQRSQLTGKKERENAKKNIVQFKSRVLDLLAILLDKQFSNSLTLEVLLPMLRLTRASANKQLADKSAKLLKSTFETHAKHKTPLPKPDNMESVWDILQGIHGESKLGGGASMHANSCSTASLHVVKVLVGLDRSNYSKITDMYAESQKQWFMNKKSPAQPVLFSQFLNWSIQFRSVKAQKQGTKAEGP